MEHREYIQKTEGKCAVLFIHGFLGSPNHFKKFIANIPEEYGVYNILLYGHGGSVRDFSKASMARWKEQVKSAFCQMAETYEKIFVVAHSMGTLFAFELAVEYPDKIDGMILLGSPLKIAVKATAFINSFKSLFGFVSEKDEIGKAYSEAHSVKLNLRLWEYLGWLPRYAELFLEARKGRINILKVDVLCYMFQSAKDELVSRKSEKYIKKNKKIRLHILENSAHFIYDTMDEELLLKYFMEMIR